MDYILRFYTYFVPNRAKVYLNNSLEILKFLLVNSEEVKAWRNKDFGLYESAFDLQYVEKKKNSLTRKIFRTRKNEFLKLKLIKKIRSRGEQKTYYSITPLGISWLFQHEQKVTSGQANKILKFLTHFYSNIPEAKGKGGYGSIEFEYKDWENLQKGFEKNLLLEFFIKAIRSVKIQNNEIFLTVPVTEYFDLNVAKFHYDENTIVLEFLFSVDKENKIVSDAYLYETISRHILLTFFLFLIIYSIEESNGPFSGEKSIYHKFKELKWSQKFENTVKKEIILRVKWFNRDIMEILYENNSIFDITNSFLESKQPG